MALYIVTICLKSGVIGMSTHIDIKDAVEEYNEAIVHNSNVEYAYLSETWATFPNRG